MKTVDVGYDLIPALTARKTDAIVGGFVNHEQLLLEKEGVPVRAFNPAKYGVPDYAELVFIANENKLKQQPDIFKNFLLPPKKASNMSKNIRKRRLPFC